MGEEPHNRWHNRCELIFDGCNRWWFMRVLKTWRWVLVYECLGFSLLVIFAWLDEFEGLPQLLFGGGLHIHDWRDSAMTTLVILFVWAIVFGLTMRLVHRLQHLEEMLRVCAWCRKIGYQNQWLKLEEYFDVGFHVHTTHGMCPDCLRKVQEDTVLLKKEEVETPAREPLATRSGAT